MTRLPPRPGPLRDLARWATHPVMWNCGDTVRGHQPRTAALARRLWPDDAATAAAAAAHDEAEFVTGDLPFPARALFPGLAAAHDAAAADIARAWRLPVPPDARSAARLALVDRLDAWREVARHAPAQLALPEWRVTTRWLQAEAARLGVAAAVERLLA